MEEVLQDEAVAGGTRLPLALRVCSVMSNSETLWTAACQAPLSVHGNFPGKNTGVGCHFLVQGIFPTQDQIRISSVSCIGRQILYH